MWLLNENWAAKLAADLRDRDLFLFGYRGADPDLTPVLLKAFAAARSVTWWELPGSDFERLEQLTRSTKAELRPGNPSDALQELGVLACTDPAPPAPRRELPSPPCSVRFLLSNVSRANVLGQFALSGGRPAVLGQGRPARPGNRQGQAPPHAPAQRRLRHPARTGAANDHPCRAPAVALSNGAASTWWCCTRPSWTRVRSADRTGGPIARLRASPLRANPQILTRIASIEKLHGDLRGASCDGEEGLAASSLQRSPVSRSDDGLHPRLELTASAESSSAAPR